jgi:hypothetical protein
MKQILALFFFFSLSIAHSQSITAPSPLTVEANASGVDAGNFVINWANNTDLLLVSINLDYIASGTTLSFPVTTGLTRTYGFNSWTNVTVINFYGVRDNVNTGLAAMTINMGAIKTAVRINVSVTQYDSNYYYNATNQHFYRYYSSSGVSYATAKSNASSLSWKGKTGYLLTITSQSENDFVNNNVTGGNIWLACTDAANEGIWKIDAGPENGTTVWTSTTAYTNSMTSVYSGGSTASGQYTSWCSGEPNNADGTNAGEDYAVSKWNSGTCWNDIAAANSSSIQGYIVEFSKDFPSLSEYTGVYSMYVIHNSDMAYTLSSTNTLNAATVSNISNLFGGLQVNNGHTVTLPSATTLNSNKMVFSGTGKIVFTDATSKWTPGTSSTSNTLTHSPSTNTNPAYWSVSSVWVNDPFNGGGSYPHYSPWLNSYQGWSAATNDSNQYIILNYDTPAYITGIITQGRATDFGQWVKTAHVEVSLDGVTWKRVLTNVSLNTNYYSSVTNLFPAVEYAKFVKVMPTDWANHITMRLGILIKQ